MAIDTIAITPGSGQLLDAVSLSNGTNTVDREITVIGDPATFANQAGVTSGGALKVDASATTQPVSGTVTVQQSTAANLLGEMKLLDSGGTNLGTVKAASTQAATTDTSLVVQLNPEQPALTTALNVHDASPASQAVTNAGTFAVQATVVPATSGGLTTPYCPIAGITNTAVEIKSSAGQVYGWSLFNPNTSTVFVLLYNASPTVGTTVPFIMIGLPAGASANLSLCPGVAFGSAIFIIASTSMASSVAPASNVFVNVFYE